VVEYLEVIRAFVVDNLVEFVVVVVVVDVCNHDPRKNK
jgi:hypothetical protein